MLAAEPQSPTTTITLTYPERMLGYTEESKAHFKRSKYIRKYLSRKATASLTSSKTYATHLAAFAFYIYKEQKGQQVDAFIDSIKAGQRDPYDILAEFASFLRESRTGRYALGANHIIQMVKTARKCLRMSGVNINNEDFREFVSLPKKVRKQKTAIDKLAMSRLLNSCKDVQLSTVVLFHAVLGPRPIEAFAVRNMDLNLESEVPKVTFRAEYSKIRVERTRYLTKELAGQLKLWLKYKYRKHRVCTKDGTMITVYPEPKPTDLVFAPWHIDESKNPEPRYLYTTMRQKFAELADTLEAGWENDNRRRKVTLYSLRRLVKTTISDLGYGDFSEYWIGHLGSTYYNKPEKERVELFRKIEPHLTYMDVGSMQEKTSDMQSELDAKDAQLRQVQEQMALVMMYLMENDPDKKAEISRKLIAKGYVPTNL
jgi:integrase